MKRLFVAVALLALAACAQTPAMADGGFTSTAKMTSQGPQPVEPQESQAGDGKVYPQMIGGPLGSPTYVVRNDGSGLLNIGAAFNGALAPIINSVVDALITAAVAWILYLLHKYLGLNIDSKNRDALVRALQNQAASLIADGAVKLDGKAVVVDNKSLASAVNEVFASVPTAAKHFGIDSAYVEKRIIDMIPQVPTPALAQPVAAVTNIEAGGPTTIETAPATPAAEPAKPAAAS